MHVVAVLGVVAVAALSGEAPYRNGREAERGEHYADAARAYRECSELGGPLAPYAALRAAVCRSYAHDLVAGIDELEGLLAAGPDGPWTAMGRHELAGMYYAAEDHDRAAILYDGAHQARVDLWWTWDLRWAAAQNLLALPAKKPEALAFFRRTAESAPWPRKRYEASQILAAHGEPGDAFLAVAGYLRSGAANEADALLREIGDAASDDSEAFARWRRLRGRVLLAQGDREEGRAVLRALMEEHGNTPVGVDALLDVFGSHVQREEFGEAEELLSQLRAWAPGSRTVASATGRLARAYARAEAFEEAIVHYEEILDDASPGSTEGVLVELGRVQRKFGRRDDAIHTFDAIRSQYPQSDDVAEAAYCAGVLLDEGGAHEEARDRFRAAVKAGLTRYYGYRAQEVLAEDGDETACRGRPLMVTPDLALVRSIDLEVDDADWALEALADDPRFERLNFFASAGYPEAEWEALGLGNAVGGEEDPGLTFRAMGEAGTAYSAMQIANADHYGDNEDGTQTVARLRIRYPRAYWGTVSALAAEMELDPYLILSVARQESTYRPGLASATGAIGVMQVMPPTAKWLVKKEPSVKKSHLKNLRDPQNSFRLGAVYLRRMLNRFDGNVVYALASYNAGPSKCEEWLRKFKGEDLVEFIEFIPFTETRNYVKRVLAHYATYYSIYPAAEYSRVDVSGQ